MPSQSTVVPESSGLSKGWSAQTLLPLTVKQIMDAAFPGRCLELQDSFVRLVGRMLNKVQHVKDVQFTLHDGAGKIDVNRWENESSDAKEIADVNDGDYVIVNGGLKGFQGKRHIVAYSVRRVTDFNEIPHHFLHCIQVHLDHTRPKAATFSASGNAAGNSISDLVMSVFNDPEAM
ncbi:hypothetical protein SORBI_3002G138900 [Sorghum bicolor]|uniref:OB domain-containing protein n=1 Tax=Sorghum bicolor TaxID=4558 RepID=A0A1W0W3R2_SORBI|nr:hypothetical protein SORBI_3002G138900 [Sorghum bicolor]